jgi:hypothetical protein
MTNIAIVIYVSCVRICSVILPICCLLDQQLESNKCLLGEHVNINTKLLKDTPFKIDLSLRI